MKERRKENGAIRLKTTLITRAFQIIGFSGSTQFPLPSQPSLMLPLVASACMSILCLRSPCNLSILTYFQLTFKLTDFPSILPLRVEVVLNQYLNATTIIFVFVLYYILFSLCFQNTQNGSLLASAFLSFFLFLNFSLQPSKVRLAGLAQNSFE